MGKKLGLGWSRALPVMRQKDDILIQKFTVAGVGVGVSGAPHGVTWSSSRVVSASEHFLLPPLPTTALSSPRPRLRRGRDKNDPNLCGGREAPLHQRKRKH